jgi:hypothetical protein
MTHYHVKSNTGGVLKDEEFHCLDDLGIAAVALKQDAQSVALDMASGCDRDGCGFCGWCRSAREVPTFSTPASLALVRLEVRLRGISPLIVDNPAGPDLALWVETAPGTAARCA